MPDNLTDVIRPPTEFWASASSTDSETALSTVRRETGALRTLEPASRQGVDIARFRCDLPMRTRVRIAAIDPLNRLEDETSHD